MYIHIICMYMYIILLLCVYIHINTYQPFVSVCVTAAADASFPEKGRTWIWGACILWMLSMFVDFRVPDSSAVVR